LKFRAKIYNVWERDRKEEREESTRVFKKKKIFRVKERGVF